MYPTEVLATNTRAKGLALSGLWLKYAPHGLFEYYNFDSRLCFISLNSIVSFVNTYAAPVGISNASWRFYFLYLVVDAVGILVIYLTFVETRGRSLEEMDRIFDDPHPVRKSLQKEEIVVKETGNGELEVAYME